jgi:hypothetical protein
LCIRIALISFGQFIATRYKFKLSTYIQEPLVIGRRGGCIERDLREKTAADNGREQYGKVAV